MNPEILDDLAIEKVCKEQFGVSADVSEVIARGVPVAASATATVFRAGSHVMLYIQSHSPLVLDDVRKIVHRMECEADAYFPPKGENEYFERVGREKFRTLFPGKPILGEDDLRYYKNLAPYNPALVRLAKVKGEIRAYDDRSKTWHKVKDFAYSKIKTNNA